MIDTMALLLSDTYKQTHDRMYPNSLKTLVSYWVPRKSMFQNEENQKMVFFGLQAFIQEYLVEYFNKNFFEVPLDDVLTTYRKYLTKTLSIVNATPTINPTITDTNSVTASLTGDSNTLIRYFSNVFRNLKSK